MVGFPLGLQRACSVPAACTACFKFIIGYNSPIVKKKNGKNGKQINFKNPEIGPTWPRNRCDPWFRTQRHWRGAAPSVTCYMLGTAEQTGAFIPFRMCDQNTTVPRRAAHSHFDWTSDLVKWELLQFWIGSIPIMKSEPLSYLSIKSSPFLDGHHGLLCQLRRKNVFSPSTLIFAVRWGKLRIYTMYNPPEVIFKLPTCDD